MRAAGVAGLKIKEEEMPIVGCNKRLFLEDRHRSGGGKWNGGPLVSEGYGWP